MLGRLALIVYHSLVKKIVLNFEKAIDDRPIAVGTVVSLTSYSRRIMGVHDTIISILNGEVLPEKIALILYKEDKKFVQSNKQLMRLHRDKLIEIYYTDQDYKSYKKIIKTNHLLPGYKWIITIDDDVYYDRSLVKLFVCAQAAAEAEGLIFCNYARHIRYEDGLPYDQWDIVKSDDLNLDTLAIGVGGIMYPADIINGFDDWTLISEIAPKQDDLWMNFIAKSKGYKVKLLNDALGHPRTTLNAYRETGLFTRNKEDNMSVYRNLLRLHGKI